MSANFTVLDSFINEFRQTYNLEEVTYYITGLLEDLNNEDRQTTTSTK